jgi:hypothetical protein
MHLGQRARAEPVSRDTRARRGALDGRQHVRAIGHVQHATAEIADGDRMLVVASPSQEAYASAALLTGL